MIELEDRVAIVAIFTHRPGARRLIASRAGYGFIVVEDELLSPRRGGKQVLVVGEAGAAVCIELLGDHVAVLGENAKVLIFPLAELPEMPRGKGVKLQAYRQGGLADVMVFESAEGASWIDAAGRTRAWSDWRGWLGKRAGAGRLAPKGFPARRRFRPAGN